MTTYEDLRAWAGGLLLGGAKRALRLRLGVTQRVHRDPEGRRTPWLDLGEPRRGTIVWLHGFSDEPDSFLRSARHLAADYRIVAPALPGFGLGWIDPDEQYTMQAFGEWATRFVMEAVSEPVHIAGNSLGGVAALTVAATVPGRVRSVVALNTAGLDVHHVPSLVDEFRGGDTLFEVRSRKDYDTLIGRLFATPVQIPGLVDAHLYRAYASQADWFARIAEDLKATAAAARGPDWEAAVEPADIRAPTLVLWGDRDTLFPVPLAERLAELLPAGRLELLLGVGHCPHIESPHRLAAALRRFYDSLSAEPVPSAEHGEDQASRTGTAGSSA